MLTAGRTRLQEAEKNFFFQYFGTEPCKHIPVLTLATRLLGQVSYFRLWIVRRCNLPSIPEKQESTFCVLTGLR